MAKQRRSVSLIEGSKAVSEHSLWKKNHSIILRQQAAINEAVTLAKQADKVGSRY